MASLLDIRRRIRAVKSTQQITKAMKMIAASKLRRAQDRVIGARPFAQQMARVLNRLALQHQHHQGCGRFHRRPFGDKHRCERGGGCRIASRSRPGRPQGAGFLQAPRV